MSIQDYKRLYTDAPLVSAKCQTNVNIGLMNPKEPEILSGAEPNDFVVCRICNTKLKSIRSHHLESRYCKEKQKRKNLVVISTNDYINLFPDAPITSKKLKDKLSKAHIGKKLSRITKKRIGNALKGRPISLKKREQISKALTGKKLTPEHIKALSLSHIGQGAWNKDLTKENDPRVAQYGKNLSKTWEQFTPEEKERRLYNSLYKSFKRPNTSESKLIPMLEPLGFGYAGNNPPNETGHKPDFTHYKHPLIIEFDGSGGHDPKMPWIPDNVSELDDQRDADYRTKGYEVLRLLPEDLKEGTLFIQNKVTKWMNQSNYTHCEPFNVGSWFK